MRWLSLCGCVLLASCLGYYQPSSEQPAGGSGGSGGSSSSVAGSGGGAPIDEGEPYIPPDDTGGGEEAAPPDAGISAEPCTGGQAQVTDPANGHCYVFLQAALPWDDASAACTALGASWHLATLTSQAEHDLVAPIVGANQTWIGFSHKVEPGFIWVNGEPTAFTNFVAGEPNGGLGQCARINPNNRGGQWADRACTSAQPYVCERE